MAELIAERASFDGGTTCATRFEDLMSVLREQLLNSRAVRLEGLGDIHYGCQSLRKRRRVLEESKVNSSQIVSLRWQFTPEHPLPETRPAH